MVMNIAFSMGGYTGAAAQFVIFWIFGLLSVSILILMEGLSAFLHTLRLHWSVANIYLVFIFSREI